MLYSFCYDTKIGRIRIAENGTAITQLGFDRPLVKQTKNLWIEEETEKLKQAAKQLTEYLNGERIRFTIELQPEGTEFQKKVWNALLKIPYGEVRSYRQIAAEIGSEKSARAVGMANNRNPIMIMIPCHRVIGSDGSLVGYAAGLHIKEKLLALEKKVIEETNSL